MRGCEVPRNVTFVRYPSNMPLKTPWDTKRVGLVGITCLLVQMCVCVCVGVFCHYLLSVVIRHTTEPPICGMDNECHSSILVHHREFSSLHFFCLVACPPTLWFLPSIRIAAFRLPCDSHDTGHTFRD